MNKINFQNLPNTTTPLNATNLNQLQTNVDDAKVENKASVYDGDLNSLKTGGWYATSTNTTNKPDSTISYFIEVIPLNINYLIQRAIRRNTIYTETYQRYYANGTWGNWVLIPAEITGTWTPTLDTVEGVEPTVDYTVTGGTRRGVFKKHGNMVFISFYLRGRITALNGTNNYATITGLPFTPKNLAAGENVIPLGVQYNCINGDPTGGVFIIYSNRVQIMNSIGSASVKWKVTPSGRIFYHLGQWLV